MEWLGTNAGPAMIGAGTALSISGNFEAARATELMAQRRRTAAEYTAQSANTAAGQQVAAGQYAAREVRRQGDITQSNLIAAAAASGAGASDPTIETLARRNAGEIQYRAALAEWQGLEAGRVLRQKGQEAIYGAEITSADAKNTADSYGSRSIATALTSAGTMASKFWMPPGKTGAAGNFQADDSGWTTYLDQTRLS